MRIRRVCQEDFWLLKSVVCDILEPIYGSQKKALNEWITGEGYKHAFVLEKGEEVTGFLSLKADPSKNYMKISTLLVFEGHQGNGFGKKLLDCSLENAKEKGYKKIKVTVSEGKEDSVDFFKKAGFKVVEEHVGKYKPGVTEIIFEKEIL